MEVSVIDVLDAMEGVVYVMDVHCSIVALGRYNWNRFAADNAGETLIDGSGVIGSSIFDFIDGDGVVASYRRVFEAILTRRRNAVRIFSRCDSPEMERRLLIMVSPVFSGRSLELLLVQSVTLSEQFRPPVDLLAFGARSEEFGDLGNRPRLVMCSYCHAVRLPEERGDCEGRWVEPGAYQRLGGALDVAVRHDVCPECLRRLEAVLN